MSQKDERAVTFAERGTERRRRIAPGPGALHILVDDAPHLGIVLPAAEAIIPADTAWMLISTALVLVMTPALGFFYGGLVRAKNALNTMMMSFMALGFVGLAGGRWSTSTPPQPRLSSL